MYLVGETEEVHTGFWWGDPTERNLFEELVIDGRLILKWVFKKVGWVMAWIGLDQYRDMWWAFVNAVVKFRGP